MLNLEKSIIIDRPIEEVFAFVANSENRPKWVSVVEVQKTSAGPIAVGTTFRNMGKMMGRQWESLLEVVEYLPNKRYTFKSTGWPFPCQLRHVFDPVAGGTQVTLTLEARLDGFFKLVEPFMVGASQRQMETDLVALKNCLEV